MLENEEKRSVESYDLQLDEVTRDMVMQNIYEELAGRTLIIIAHDRSILKSCDKILCLKDGKLKEFNAEINCN